MRVGYLGNYKIVIWGPDFTLASLYEFVGGRWVPLDDAA